MVLKIANLESTCDPTEVNDNPKTGDYSVGFMQINIYGKLKEDRPPEHDLKSLKTNLAIAYQIYKNSGHSFRQWSTCRKIRDCQ